MRGWSQTDLAEKSGMQPSAISHFEVGRRAPSFENLKRLADALQVSMDYLLGRVAEPTGAGHGADKFFRDFSKMTDRDQEIIARLVADYAERNKEKKGESKQ
jgi:transcriptional regulator with XRE-family HTH domain